MAIEVARIAGWAFSVRSRRSDGPSQASALIGSRESRIGGREDGRGGGGPFGESAAHAHGL